MRVETDCSVQAVYFVIRITHTGGYSVIINQHIQLGIIAHLAHL